MKFQQQQCNNNEECQYDTSCMSDSNNNDSDSEEVDNCLNFLENIEKALEDDPLTISAEKRSKQFALRHKLKTYKQQDNKMSLNLKKMTQHTKRINKKFENQILLKASQDYLQNQNYQNFNEFQKNDQLSGDFECQSNKQNSVLFGKRQSLNSQENNNLFNSNQNDINDKSHLQIQHQSPNQNSCKDNEVTYSIRGSEEPTATNTQQLQFQKQKISPKSSTESSHIDDLTIDFNINVNQNKPKMQQNTVEAFQDDTHLKLLQNNDFIGRSQQTQIEQFNNNSYSNYIQQTNQMQQSYDYSNIDRYFNNQK